jgi:uncharacterized CHY-type Zn-finger protein
LKETVKDLINKTDENTRSIFKFDSVNKDIVNLRISMETKFKSVYNKFESVNKDNLILNSSFDSMKNFIIGGIITTVAAVSAGTVLNIICRKS